MKATHHNQTPEKQTPSTLLPYLLLAVVMFVLLMFAGCTTPVDVKYNGSIPAMQLYDATHIILPEGVDVVVVNKGELAAFKPSANTAYVLESHYAILEQKYLLLLEALAKNKTTDK